MPEPKGQRPIAASQRPTGGDKAAAVGKKQYFRRKKVCRFCVEKIDDINYKDVRMLQAFIAERGKIVPRRISGVCAQHQRRLTDAILKARNIALRALRGGDLRGNRGHGSHSPADDIDNLGKRGEVVKVAPGYARNFLLPKRLAVAATDSNRKIVEQERQAHLRKETKLKGEAEELSKLVGAATITISRKAGENDQLFGSVTAADIADALAAQKFTVERRRIHLDEPIRTLGEHKVQVWLHKDVTAEVTVKVTREQ